MPVMENICTESEKFSTVLHELIVVQMISKFRMIELLNNAKFRKYRSRACRYCIAVEVMHFYF